MSRTCPLFSFYVPLPSQKKRMTLDLLYIKKALQFCVRLLLCVYPISLNTAFLIMLGWQLITYTDQYKPVQYIHSICWCNKWIVFIINIRLDGSRDITNGS